MIENYVSKGFYPFRRILSGSKSYGKEKLIIEKINNRIVRKTFVFKKDDSKMEIDEFANSILRNKKI